MKSSYRRSHRGGKDKRLPELELPLSGDADGEGWLEKSGGLDIALGARESAARQQHLVD